MEWRGWTGRGVGESKKSVYVPRSEVRRCCCKARAAHRCTGLPLSTTGADNTRRRRIAPCPDQESLHTHPTPHPHHGIRSLVHRLQGRSPQLGSPGNRLVHKPSLPDSHPAPSTGTRTFGPFGKTRGQAIQWPEAPSMLCRTSGSAFHLIGSHQHSISLLMLQPISWISPHSSVSCHLCWTKRPVALYPVFHGLIHRLAQCFFST
jgi:hypothetical protein